MSNQGTPSPYKEIDPDVKAAIQKDGSLYCLGWYLSYTPPDQEATLDGEFTANQLRSIAQVMEDANELARDSGKD